MRPGSEKTTRIDGALLCGDTQVDQKLTRPQCGRKQPVFGNIGLVFLTIATECRNTYKCLLININEGANMLLPQNVNSFIRG